MRRWLLALGLLLACEPQRAAERGAPERVIACSDAEPLTTCEQRCRDGDADSCHALQRRILRPLEPGLDPNPDPDLIARAAALLGERCRAGQASRCSSAAELLERAGGSEASARAVELLERGCRLGASSSCWALAERTDDHARALQLRFRTCELDPPPEPRTLDEFAELDLFVWDQSSARALACGYVSVMSSRDLEVLSFDCGARYRGDLRITSAAELESFARFAWTCLDGDLEITQLVDVSDLSGLESLRIVRGRVQIENNPSLESLTGLERLTYVGSDLEISKNPRLRSLAGLRSLTTIRGSYLTIDDNPELESLRGLGSLVRVGSDPVDRSWPLGSLWILNNERLETLAGLESLRSLPKGMWIRQNPNLRSLGGLGSLQVVGGLIRVEENPKLTDIRALQTIEALPHEVPLLASMAKEDDEIYPDFENNAELSECEVDRLLRKLSPLLERRARPGKRPPAGCE